MNEMKRTKTIDIPENLSEQISQNVVNQSKLSSNPPIKHHLIPSNPIETKHKSN
jgi:hypothetical protein